MSRPIRALVTVLAALALVASACQSVTPTHRPTASPSPTPTPTSTPASTPTPTPTSSPTIDPNATPTPLPTGGPGAYYFVMAYEDDLVNRFWDDAWARLSKPSQAHWGTKAKFITDRVAFLAKSGDTYEEELNPPNTLTIAQWAEGRGWKINPGANLVSIHWTSYSDPARSWEIWVVSPIPTGWELYLAN
jgi:hypothetical protein